MANINTDVAQNGNNNQQLIQDEPGISLVDILENVFFFRWYFLLAFIVVFAISAAYAVLATPVYVSDLLIQVEEKKGSSLGALSQVAKALDVQQSPVLGEVEIIRSRNVIGRAVESLKDNIKAEVDNRIPIIGNGLRRFLTYDADGLAQPLWTGMDFAWGGEDLRLEEFVVPQSLLGAPFYLKVGPDRTWNLLGPKGESLLKGKGTGEDGDALDGALRFKIKLLKARPGTRFKVTAYSMQSRISQISARLTVAEARRQSGILKLTYEESSSNRAAEMLNAVADAYLQQNLERRSEEAERSLAFLTGELPKLKQELEKSEKALNDFRNQERTIDIGGEIKELLDRATQAEKARVELELKRKEYSERYEPAHPAVKAVNSQLATLKAESAGLVKDIGRLPQVQQNYIRLARNVEVTNQLYVGLLNNAQQLQIAKAGTVGNVAIVDRAVVAERPTRPNKPLTVAIGGLLGLILGFTVCQLLGLITGVVRDPKRLEASVGLPTLAILPLAGEQVEEIERGEKSGRDGVFVLAKEKPNSIAVEALRTLRTSLLFALSAKQRSKVVLLTSAVPSQGKSFISANLSYLLAATGKRVLLIEADVRRASIKRYIDFTSTSVGLSSILTQGMKPDEAILKSVHPNLDFLAAGPRVKNPGDMLSTDTVQSLVKSMAELYDYVIIDSPPLLPVNDARSLANAADVTLFIARQEMVSTSEIRDAIDIFNKSGNRIDGLVFNGFVPSYIRYGYGYGYGYRGAYLRYGKYQQYGKTGYGYGDGRYGGYGTDPKEVELQKK